MKDEMQNLIDLIGALAEDIEAVKAKLDAKDASDKDEAVKRLAVKLEPVIRFFGGSTPTNINEIFKSKDAIEDYKNPWATKWLSVGWHTPKPTRRICANAAYRPRKTSCQTYARCWRSI